MYGYARRGTALNLEDVVRGGGVRRDEQVAKVWRCALCIRTQTLYMNGRRRNICAANAIRPAFDSSELLPQIRFMTGRAQLGIEYL